MEVEKLVINPAYRKDNGQWTLDTQALLPEDAFEPAGQALIWLPPGEFAGNHRHKRREAIFGIGTAAFFLWQDDQGVVHKEAMNPEGVPYLFLVPPYVPHAVVNESLTEPAILYEFFDDTRREVERVQLVEGLAGS